MQSDSLGNLPADSAGRPYIYYGRIRRGKSEKCYDRRSSQICRGSCNRHGMGVNVIFPGNMVLGKVDAMPLFDKGPPSGHTWQVMFVNPQRFRLGRGYEAMMIFGKIPKFLVRCHVKSMPKRICFVNRIMPHAVLSVVKNVQLEEAKHVVVHNPRQVWYNYQRGDYP